MYAGTGTVWENPTRGIPVRNPTGGSHFGSKILDPQVAEIWISHNISYKIITDVVTDPYLCNLGSNIFEPKCDPPVFSVFQPLKYFGIFTYYISNVMANLSQCTSLNHGNTTGGGDVVIQG